MKPILVGLGSAAVLAASGASAIAGEQPSPTPSESGSASPAPGKLGVDVFTKPANPDAGDTVDVTAIVSAAGGPVADVRVKGVTASVGALTGACAAPYDADACAAGDLSEGEDKVFSWDLEAPEKTKKVTVTVTVGGAGVEDVSAPATVTFVLPTPTKTPTSEPSPTKKPTKKPTRKPTGTPSPTSSGTGGSGGGSGSGSGGSTGGVTGSSSSSGTGVVPPQPNSSFNARNPEVALPQVEAPSPSVAPGAAAATPQSRLQGNEAPVAQDLTFERMASTQVAWLAALLVAFSLLLTQLRLGRRRLAAGTAVRVKGAHRRPRKGMFGR